MRKSENRKKINKLYILGAGSSYSLTINRSKNGCKQAPLDAEFCHRIVDLKDMRPKWLLEARKRILTDWKDHLPFEMDSLEKSIIKQIGHFDFLSSIHPRRGTGGRRIEDYLYDISHVISYVLSKTKENISFHGKAFIKAVFPKDVDFFKQNNRIITFNYDTIIDKYLLKRYSLSKVYFDNLRREKKSKQKSGKSSFPLIVKLHGSTNWRVTKSNFQRIISSDDDSDSKIRKTRTYDTTGCCYLDPIWFSENVSSPDNDDTPLIIPPLPLKPITNVAIFRYLWTYAYEYLHECKELVICGYSLPETDTLAVSMFSNFTNKKLEKLTIIDPNANVINKWKQLIQRKGVNTVTLEYFDDFADYINRGFD